MELGWQSHFRSFRTMDSVNNLEAYHTNHHSANTLTTIYAALSELKVSLWKLEFHDETKSLNFVTLPR